MWNETFNVAIIKKSFPLHFSAASLSLLTTTIAENVIVITSSSLSIKYYKKFNTQPSTTPSLFSFISFKSFFVLFFHQHPPHPRRQHQITPSCSTPPSTFDTFYRLHKMCCLCFCAAVAASETFFHYSHISVSHYSEKFV